MENKSILKSLVAISEKQQNILTKLAQISGDEVGADRFVANTTSAWLANNGINVKYRTSLTKSNDLQHDYTISLIMAPALPNAKLPANILATYKGFISKKALEHPFLANKSIKVDAKIVPSL
jgi:hypothetical protein